MGTTLKYIMPVSAALAAVGVVNAENTRPNVVLIVADDMGYGGLTCYGGQGLSTPHLDDLARNGVMCTNFHTNAPVSSPTRVSFLTGRFQQRTGLDHIYSETDPSDGLPPEFKTLAWFLQQSGYRTGIFGKWHLGESQAYNPLDYGFDRFVGFMKGNIDFSSHFNTSRKLDWWHDRELSEESGYATTLLNGYAAEFIAESDERPFFLYVPHAAIHVPMQGPTDPPVRTEEKYRYRNDVTMSSQEYARRYREMVASIDEGVGMLLDELEKAGKLDNTIIIFISDNGAEQVAADKYPGANGIYRGAKGSLYEGGIRVPAIFYWKDRIRPSVNDDFMMSMDLFPTILDVCGVGYDRSATDGKTLVDAIWKGKSMPERKMFWANKGICAMKDGDFKCVWTKDRVELFDISADPEEKHDLGTEYPGKVKSMQKSIVKWWNEVTKGNRLEGYSIFDLEIPLSKQMEK